MVINSTMPILLLFGVAVMLAIWIATAIKNQALLNAFKERMPEQAKAVLPSVFRHGRDPKKVWFFFTKKAEEVLARDPSLAEMCRSFRRMSIASLIFPFALFFLTLGVTLIFAR